MVKFKLQYLSDYQYVLSWRQPVPGKQPELFTSRITFKRPLLRHLLAEARSRISTTLAMKSQVNPNYRNLFKQTQYEWDQDVSELPPFMQSQADKELQRQAILTGKTHRVEEPEKLFYFEHVAGHAYLRKAERPLMTWEEACAELRKKMEA